MYVQQTLPPASGSYVEEPPAAASPSRQPKRFSVLGSAASQLARKRHAELATHYTAGRLAAWDDIPCMLVPANMNPSGEAAAEWQRGFKDGYAERKSLEGAA